jgi:hypothetical protein
MPILVAWGFYHLMRQASSYKHVLKFLLEYINSCTFALSLALFIPYWSVYQSSSFSHSLPAVVSASFYSDIPVCVFPQRDQFLYTRCHNRTNVKVSSFPLYISPTACSKIGLNITFCPDLQIVILQCNLPLKIWHLDYLAEVYHWVNLFIVFLLIRPPCSGRHCMLRWGYHCKSTSLYIRPAHFLRFVSFGLQIMSSLFVLRLPFKHSGDIRFECTLGYVALTCGLCDSSHTLVPFCCFLPRVAQFSLHPLVCQF